MTLLALQAGKIFMSNHGLKEEGINALESYPCGETQTIVSISGDY